MDPVSIALDFASGRLEPVTGVVQRRLSDMAGAYAAADAVREILSTHDPLIYEVQAYEMPAQEGQLSVCTTILYPGLVGNEFFMTKGHYHEKADRSEVYLGLQGRGLLLMEVDGRFAHFEMGAGTVAYVPPYWAHRTVNTGDVPFIFLAIYPADAGHNYASIERDGFMRRVVERDGVAVLEPS
jgi:glucose-6-phosphate isomerase